MLPIEAREPIQTPPTAKAINPVAKTNLAKISFPGLSIL
ncbi:hypothetical protein JCM19314_3708 [Nonlabens ulvanivorans]|uniref:Uncharacterized protein n=1 Tax=Nonlabens ulvanivorans TaxID=906888 RepID=A0A090QD05_NONUL|nr:hypothetical protein JCM19314_3708 [Nonlabens ulvanivorans]